MSANAPAAPTAAAGAAASSGGRGGGQHAGPQALVLPPPQDELVAVRRVNKLASPLERVSQKFPAPHSAPGPTHHFTVYLVSDSYLGFDQQIQFRVTTAARNANSAGTQPSAPQQQLQPVKASAAAAAAAAADPDDIYN